MKCVGRLVIGVFSISIFFSCSKNAVTGRKQLNLIPERELISMSLTEYDNFLKQHKKLPEYDNRVVQVRKVGDKIKQAVEQFYAQKNLNDARL